MSDNIKWGPIGEEVYNRTYSRTKPDGTKETWDETVERVVDGNCDLVKDIRPVSNRERELLKLFIKQFKIMPAGRHLWVSGIEDRQYLFNCHRAGWTSNLIDHCCFMFLELMRGGGVGANYSMYKEYIPRKSIIEFHIEHDHPDAHRLPDYMKEQMLDTADDNADFFIIEDSQAGWVNALKLVIESHFKATRPFVLDFTDIRPSGDMIKGFGGTASGPYSLMTMLESVHNLLNDKADKALTGLDLMDIDHLIAQCVISGNVRRSARMSIMHWQDPQIEKFIFCKKNASKHWTTNISVELDQSFWDKLDLNSYEAKHVLQLISEGMRLNGEPGIFNSHLAAVDEDGEVRCTNPCGEIALEEWENCNLGHLNLALLEMKELSLAAKLMARFLVRATLSPDVNPMQKPVLYRNRRIGVGLYGFQEYLINTWEIEYSQIEANSSYISKDIFRLRNETIRAADKYAELLEINPPVKHTTIAPTGTISTLSGHTPGIHPVAAKFFIRRVRYSETDNALNYYPEHMKERDIVSDHTVIVKHLCRDTILDNVWAPWLVETGEELTINQQLAAQEFIQKWWADNAVSYTVQLSHSDSVRDIYDGLLKYGKYIKGSTMFPPTSIPQPPIEALTQEEYNELKQIQESSTSQADLDCFNEACPVR